MRGASRTALHRWASAWPSSSCSTAKVPFLRISRFWLKIVQFRKEIVFFCFYVQVLFVAFLLEYHPSLLKVGSKSKLSFIGHSMGGLIIRAALQVCYYILPLEDVLLSFFLSFLAAFGF